MKNSSIKSMLLFLARSVEKRLSTCEVNDIPKVKEQVRLIRAAADSF